MRRQRWTIALCAVLMTPCFAGHLEEGTKALERGKFAVARQEFEKSAAEGNAEALRQLGFIYYHGQGVRQDNAKAVMLFEKAAAAGDVTSAFNLAKMYEYGMGVAQDDVKAASWYRKGAEAGDSLSQWELSIMLYKGEGVAQDRVEAAKWWTVASATGEPRLVEMVRRSTQSAEAKMAHDEIAEGKRRAQEWLARRKSR